MNKILLSLSVAFTIATTSVAQEVSHIASFQTNMEDAAETVAFDAANAHAIITNSDANNLMIIDLEDVENPSLINTIDLSPYGAGPNSVAFMEEMIIVAVEAEVKQENGVVVFFNNEGGYLGQFEAGALPDMVTAAQSGDFILVANEGEPNDDYTVDPVGSITKISNDNTITTFSFDSFNDKKEYLINKGIRIFGNNGNATVAEDLEPEFITISADETKAFVVCQENNAIVVLDLIEDEVLDILPLGYKNHSLGTATVNQYNLNELVADWPSLGTPVYDGGQDEVMLGGFSGLYVDENNSTEESITFYVVPDRGPNDSPVAKDHFSPALPQKARPFKLPNYQGRIVKFTMNLTSGEVTLDEQIMLTRQDGTTPITGKGNIPGVDEVPVTYADANTDYATDDYIDTETGETYFALPYDELGGDFEGIVMDNDGNFWMCDEYRPAIYKFEPNGTLIERYVAEGTHLLGDTEVAEGTYGAETLPAVYAKRRANRGFEAIAYDTDNNTIYTWIQTPLYNPSSVTKNNSDVIRILATDATNGMPTGEYVFLLERNKFDGFAEKRVDKIGDAVYTGNGQFLVVERDATKTSKTAKKYVFEIDLNFATNVLGQDFGDTTLELMTADEIKAAGVQVANKIKMFNAPSIGYVNSDKLEGLGLVPGGKLALMNDNDFGLAGAGITDNSVLGIVSFEDDYSFDASNRDDAINIENHPTYGMFMPDGIASYTVEDKTYIVTANEGDARDYDGYSEEERVADLSLNNNYFPNASNLQENENLGRLKTTTANGDLDGDGTFEQIFSYGARSFSIFDQYGNLVFDSANDFAVTVADVEPNLFNQDDGDFDDRSDDKGVEPEAVAIGSIEGNTYAFIGLERQNGIMVYDITNPFDVEFITYYNGNVETGDVAPEIIKFVNQADSPNNKPLLLVGYEVSGTLGILEVGEDMGTISNEVRGNTFELYPNPSVGSTLYSNKEISGSIYSIDGRLMTDFVDTKTINTGNLTTGVYIVKTKENGSKRFIKK